MECKFRKAEFKISQGEIERTKSDLSAPEYILSETEKGTLSDTALRAFRYYAQTLDKADFEDLLRKNSCKVEPGSFMEFSIEGNTVRYVFQSDGVVERLSHPNDLYIYKKDEGRMIPTSIFEISDHVAKEVI